MSRCGGGTHSVRPSLRLRVVQPPCSTRRLSGPHARVSVLIIRTHHWGEMRPVERDQLIVEPRYRRRWSQAKIARYLGMTQPGVCKALQRIACGRPAGTESPRFTRWRNPDDEPDDDW